MAEAFLLPARIQGTYYTIKVQVQKLRFKHTWQVDNPESFHIAWLKGPLYLTVIHKHPKSITLSQFLWRDPFQIDFPF